MKRHIKYIGLYMVYFGNLLLLSGFIFGWTEHYAMLFIPLLFVIAGLVVHIWMLKKGSKY